MLPEQRPELNTGGYLEVSDKQKTPHRSEGFLALCLADQLGRENTSRRSLSFFTLLSIFLLMASPKVVEGWSCCDDSSITHPLDGL